METGCLVTLRSTFSAFLNGFVDGSVSDYCSIVTVNSGEPRKYAVDLFGPVQPDTEKPAHVRLVFSDEELGTGTDSFFLGRNSEMFVLPIFNFVGSLNYKGKLPAILVR